MLPARGGGGLNGRCTDERGREGRGEKERERYSIRSIRNVSVETASVMLPLAELRPVKDKSFQIHLDNDNVKNANKSRM